MRRTLKADTAHLHRKRVAMKYRLYTLSSTTPQDLFRRKLETKEFGIAFELATKYGLDKVEVYKRQWLNAAQGVFAVKDYLAKVKKFRKNVFYFIF